MNNTIFILIDSVYSGCIGDKKTKESSTPFIDKLAKEGLLSTNIFSYAPYTDAATIGLYCGIPTLETLGYYYGINTPDYNHFRIFKENGYETFGLYYPFYLISSKTKQYIDHVVYTGGFEYGSVWFGKLEYYANAKKQRELSQTEYSLIEKCLEMIFDCWLTFYNDISNNEQTAVLVKEMDSNELNASGIEGLKLEYEKFCKSRREYVVEVLDMGMAHPLAKINSFDFGTAKHKEFYNKIFTNHKDFFKKIQKVNTKRNLKNNRLRFGKAFKSALSLIGIGDRSRSRYVKNYGMLLAGNKLLKKRALNSRGWQYVNSFNKQIDTLFQTLKSKSKDKPFYASLHVEEPHHNIAYFSYDCFDEKIIADEVEYLKPLVDGCGKKFSGNLLYQLALRYSDLCVKRLFEKLKENNLYDNTTVVLVSDHGTSYSFSPVRTKVVNTFHTENYNVPLLIWKKDMPKNQTVKLDAMFSSEDVLSTLCSIEGLKIPSQLKGKVMYNQTNGRDYVITEYMGPGVPDMLEREVWLSIRDKDYVIAYKNDIRQPLNVDKPCVIYDLALDPKEMKNLWDKVKISNNERLSYLAQELTTRYEVIRANTSEIINNLDKLKV